MEVKKFFEENIKPLINKKIWEQEDYVETDNLSYYISHPAVRNVEPAWDEYDEDEMYDACVKLLVESIEADGVFEVFYKEMTEEARKVLYDATDEYNEALDKMTIKYIEE